MAQFIANVDDEVAGLIAEAICANHNYQAVGWDGNPNPLDPTQFVVEHLEGVFRREIIAYRRSVCEQGICQQIDAEVAAIDIEVIVVLPTPP